jgi:hypothetical protein
MRFQTFVLVPDDTRDIVTTVTHLLEPYDVNRKVPPHREWVPEDEIQEMVETFDIPRDDLEALTAELHDDSGFEVGIEAGRLYWLTTDNPQGHWDSCMLHGLEESVWPVPAIPNDSVPFAIVTPDGAWNDLGYAWDTAESAPVALRRRAQPILDRYPTYLAVVMDCHL